MIRILLALLIAAPSFAQKQQFPLSSYPFAVDSLSGNISYVGVEEVAGVTADQLYTRAKSFVFKAFPVSDRAIKADDKAGGLLGATGSVPSNTVDRLILPIEFRFKDGRYRYEISGMEVAVIGQRLDLNYAMQNTGMNPIKPMTVKQHQRTIDYMKYATLFVQQLKEAMLKPSGKEDF